MLNSIKIANFKSFRNQSLPLSPLTLLIGANASGKSNAIEAFQFLSWLAGGQKLTVLTQAVSQSDQIVRGGIHTLPTRGTSSFEVGCSLDISECDTTWQELDIALSIRDDELHIVQEKIHTPDESQPLYQITQPSSGFSTDVLVAYNNFARGRNKPQLPCTDQMAIMCQLISPAMFKNSSSARKPSEEIPKTTTTFQQLLANSLFIDPVPAEMRQVSSPARKLSRNCSNMAGVLYNLCKHEDQKHAVLAFIRSLPEQNITDIHFYADHNNRITFELEETFGGKADAYPMDLLSDGTLRVLAIAAAILSSQPGTVVVIEEVDNGIHPSRANQLLATMQAMASKAGIRLLLSTHNPAMMNALPDSALDDVVFCYRDPNHGDSRLVRLSDIHAYPSLVLQGTLGNLITRGVVDRFVKAPHTPQQRKQAAMEWLQKLHDGSHSQ